MNYNYIDLKYNRHALTEYALNSTDINWQLVSKEADYWIGSLKTREFVKDIVDGIPNTTGGVLFFKNAPQKPHIDRTRRSAINFPLNVPSKFFVAKEYPSPWFDEKVQERDPYNISNAGSERTKKVLIYNLEADSEQFNEHFYVKRSIDCAYALNVAVPHGALNKTNKDRYILTVSYDIPYSELIERLAGMNKLIDDPYAKFSNLR